MKDTKSKHVEHIRQVGRDVQAFIESLVKENELQSLRVKSLEQENATLVKRLQSLQEDADARSQEHNKLMSMLDEMSSDNSDLHRRLNEVVGQSNDLTNLYVSSYQLHASLDYDAVMAALQEIIINIVGSESFLVLALQDDGDTLAPLTSFGVDEEDFAPLQVDSESVVGQVIQTVETFVADDTTRGEFRGRSVEACVPLLLDGAVYGVVIIFELLPQKPQLAAGDRELFDLLSTHAAVALYCTELHRSRPQ